MNVFAQALLRSRRGGCYRCSTSCSCSDFAQCAAVLGHDEELQEEEMRELLEKEEEEMQEDLRRMQGAAAVGSAAQPASVC